MLTRLAANVRRTLAGRPAWNAESEYAYYAVTPDVVREHEARQREFASSGDSLGRRLVEDMGIVPMLRDATVLDIGSGECVLTFGMAAAGAKVVWATDAVPKQIWAAAARGNDKVRFCIADAQDLPFADGAFDLVTAHLVLHHIEPLSTLMNEAFRALRPGGYFCAMEPTRLVGSLTHEVLSENEAPISRRYVRKALERAGFQDVQFTYYWSRMKTSALGPFSPLYRVVAQKPGTPTAIAANTLRRPLESVSKLSSLEIDSQCKFTPLALKQADEIQRLRPSAS